jgi:nitroreductase
MTITEYLAGLQWRYATKQFDATKKLSDEQVQFVKDVLRLSPSSTGVQPWKFVIVSDPVLRQKLREKAYGQPQITDASLLVVFCRRTDVDAAHVEKVIARTAKVRQQTSESLQGYREMMLGVINQTPDSLKEWASDQVFIALGMLVSACAALRIDACPMGGFDRTAFDDILQLEKEHCTSYAVCAIGFRSADDKYAKAAKSRLVEAEVIVEK